MVISPFSRTMMSKIGKIVKKRRNFENCTFILNFQLHVNLFFFFFSIVCKFKFFTCFLELASPFFHHTK